MELITPRLREADYFNGRYWDTLLYAVLVDEWRGMG